MKRLTLNLSFIIISFYSFSQTIYFAGTINSNTTWAADSVIITGDVIINATKTLTINPGTVIEFQGHFPIRVHGVLKAIGTENDSIFFTINDTTGFHEIDSTYGGWHGLRFSNCYSDTSILSYCKLEYAKGTDGITGYTDDDMGSVVYCSYSNLVITHCLIENNNSVASGAICFENNSSADYNFVSENIIRMNKTLFYGAGVYSYVSYPHIINNIIIQNYAESKGGGILCSGSTPEISGNVICNNMSEYSGGGIVISWGSSARIINNLICNNSAPIHGGILISSSDALIVNNSICNNIAFNTSGGGMGVTGSTINVYNTIYWGNSANLGQQIAIWQGCTTNFSFCNIQGDTNSFYMPQSPFTGIYYNNKNTNPDFTDPSSGSGVNYNGYNSDWSLTQNSICINNGTPDTSGLMLPQLDVYGNIRIVNSIVDIGAAEYPILQADKIDDELIKLFIYPNPTHDKLNIEIEKKATLEILNEQGQIVDTKVLNERANNLDIYNLGSGIYTLRIKTDRGIVIRKFIKQ